MSFDDECTADRREPAQNPDEDQTEGAAIRPLNCHDANPLRPSRAGWFHTSPVGRGMDPGSSSSTAPSTW